MTRLDQLKAMAAECGLDWDTAKHIHPVRFALLLDAVRKQKGKTREHA